MPILFYISFNFELRKWNIFGSAFECRSQRTCRMLLNVGFLQKRVKRSITVNMPYILLFNQLCHRLPLFWMHATITVAVCCDAEWLVMNATDRLSELAMRALIMSSTWLFPQLPLHRKHSLRQREVSKWGFFFLLFFFNFTACATFRHPLSSVWPQWNRLARIWTRNKDSELVVQE